MMKRVFIILLVLITFSTSAFALSLDQAKSSGLVGETPAGYLEAVSAPTSDVQALIKDINSRRKEEYQAIAKKNGTSLQAVEALAGKKAVEKTSMGHFVKIQGNWQKK